MEKVKLPCIMGDTCEYEIPELAVTDTMQLLDKHLLGVHEQEPAETGPVADPKFKKFECEFCAKVFKKVTRSSTTCNIIPRLRLHARFAIITLGGRKPC